MTKNVEETRVARETGREGASHNRWADRFYSHYTWTILVVLIAVCLYSVMIPPGLPYDEPSHWGYVRFLAAEMRLPTLGDRSVGYEAQMGPIAYIPYAALLKIWTTGGGGLVSGLVITRMLGAVPVAALVILTERIVCVVSPESDTRLRWAGVSIALLNPMILAMSSSIQNDTMALAIFAGMLLYLVQDRHCAPWHQGLIVGLLAGLCVLTKLSMLPAVLICLVWPVYRRNRVAVAKAGIAVLTFLVVTAWWFVRNQALYGDMTARTAAAKYGTEFPPLGGSPIQLLGNLFRAAITYLWLPVEYYRNLIVSPNSLDLLIVAATILILGGGLLHAITRAPANAGLVLVMLVAVGSIGAWAATDVYVQAVAFRTAYAALPLYSVMAVWTLSRLSEVLTHGQDRRFSYGAFGMLLSLNAWVLVVATGLTYAA